MKTPHFIKVKSASKILAGLTITAAILPSLSLAATAATPFYAGWIPFWKEDSGAQEAMQHLSSLKEISPFSYELDPEIGVVDKMDVSKAPWPELFAAARANNVKIVPSIASMNGGIIHSMLKSPAKRSIHIEDIWGTILLNNYDGIDIDYEGKKAATKPYYSAFIKELSGVLHAHKKILSCTVESRTPAASRFAVARPPIEYANDYAVLNKYCDEVRIMAYDQANIDLKLDKSKGAKRFYLPVADPDWVDKVIRETLKTISPKKVVLGIPTYGYEYELPAGGGLPNFYDKTKSVTFSQAMTIASSTGSTPARNSAGELSFAYFKQVNQNGVTMAEPRVVWFTDAESIAQKLALVKKYKLKGAAFFKFDGEADQSFWNLLSAK